MEKPMYRVLALAGRLLQNLQLHLRHGPETAVRAGEGMHSTEYQPIDKVSAMAMIKGKNYGRYNKSQETKVAEEAADTAADQQQTQTEEPQSNVQKAVQEFHDTGKVSNRMAEVILNDAEAVAALLVRRKLGGKPHELSFPHRWGRVDGKDMK